MTDLNQVSGQILNSALQIHTRLGAGLFESVYETILAHELRKRGLHVERQKAIGIKYDSLYVADAFHADLVVEHCIIVEIKSVAQLAPVHSKQLTTYLRLSDYRLGLLFNFGAESLMDGFQRIANRM
jgi:iron complex transport system substrate-binding protein